MRHMIVQSILIVLLVIGVNLTPEEGLTGLIGAALLGLFVAGLLGEIRTVRS